MRHPSVLVLLVHLAIVANASGDPAKAPRLDVNGDLLPEGVAARLGTARFQAPGFSGAVALSPDGKILAAVAHEDDGVSIHFMDAATGKTVRRLGPGAKGENRFQNLDTLPRFDLNGYGLRLQFTADGKDLVTSSWIAGAELIDGVTGRRTRIPVEGPNGHIAFTSNRKWIAAQQEKQVYDAPVGIWDAGTGKEAFTLPGRGASCKELLFGSDDKRLLLWSIVPTQAGGGSLSFGSDSKVALACIDVPTRKIVGEHSVGTSQHVALGPDGETVAFETADNESVRIRHLPTGADAGVIAVRQAKFAFAPDGKTLLTIDRKGEAALWDAARGTKIRDLELALANEDFRILGISKDGKTIAAVDGGWQSAPAIVIWNGDTGKRVGRPAGHDGAVTCIVYAPGGKLLASGSIDRTVQLWNPATGEHLGIAVVHKEAITAIAISPDGKLLASASKEGTIRLARLPDGEHVAAIAGPDRGAKALAFSADGKLLFAGGHSPQVLAWDTATAKEQVRLRTGDDGSVMAFADGGGLATSTNGEVRFDVSPARLQVWQPLRKTAEVSISIRRDDGGYVRCDAATFSPDGRMLASSQISTYEGIRPSYGAAQLRLWERWSGQPILTLSPTITSVLAFSPNGRLLASGGAGKSGHLQVGYGPGIDIWDSVSGKKAGVLALTPVCVAFSPDGKHLAVGSREHEILIWEAPGAQPPAAEVKAPSANQREGWWLALRGEAAFAYNAMGQMIDAPEHAVAFLKERVRLVPISDPVEVAKLIALLDGETYAERLKAQTALEKMGEGTAHLIAKALEGKVNLELRRRLEALLIRCSATSPQSTQHHRAVATLEWIGTPEARALLRRLADGAPRARLTTEAAAALSRLKG